MKVDLAPGQSQLVSVQLSAKDLAFYDAVSAAWVVADGKFVVHIGGSSEAIQPRVQGRL